MFYSVLVLTRLRQSFLYFFVAILDAFRNNCEGSIWFSISEARGWVRNCCEMFVLLIATFFGTGFVPVFVPRFCC